QFSQARPAPIPSKATEAIDSSSRTGSVALLKAFGRRNAPKRTKPRSPASSPPNLVTPDQLGLLAERRCRGREFLFQGQARTTRRFLRLVPLRLRETSGSLGQWEPPTQESTLSSV